MMRDFKRGKNCLMKLNCEDELVNKSFIHKYFTGIGYDRIEPNVCMIK